MMNARSDINFFQGSLPLLPPNSTRGIASASNVVRVTKLGKGHSLALAARARRLSVGLGNDVILHERNGGGSL